MTFDINCLYSMIKENFLFVDIVKIISTGFDVRIWTWLIYTEKKKLNTSYQN